MNYLLSTHFALPFATLNSVAWQQERRGLTWGLILLILLIGALLILWWLLGPGAKRRRERMGDLPTPAPGAPPKSHQASTTAPHSGPQPKKPTPPSVAPAVAASPVLAVENVATVEDTPEEDTPEIAAIVDEAESAGETIVAPVDEVVEELGDGESASSPNPTEPDNLRKLEGIGPKVAGILIANGIGTFAELSATNIERLAEILEAEGLKFMKPDTWPEQAAFAAKGDWDGLQHLQSQLKGGRRIEE